MASHRIQFLAVLFIIDVNYMDVGLNNLISKFAEDTKIGNSVLNDEDRQSFKEDFHKIPAWSAGWEVSFKKRKVPGSSGWSKKKEV